MLAHKWRGISLDAIVKHYETGHKGTSCASIIIAFCAKLFSFAHNQRPPMFLSEMREFSSRHKCQKFPRFRVSWDHGRELEMFINGNRSTRFSRNFKNSEDISKSDENIWTLQCMLNFESLLIWEEMKSSFTRYVIIRIKRVIADTTLNLFLS